MKKLFVLCILVLSMLSASVLGATVTLRPDANGNYVGWTNQGRTAATEYKCVNEVNLNTSDSVYTNGKNIKETFPFSNSGLSGYAINSVTLYYQAKYYSSSKYNIVPVIRYSSTDYQGATKTLTSTYAQYTQAYATHPATGNAWTWAQVDDLEAGMFSANTNKGGGYVAQIYAVVEYSIPDSCSDTDGGDAKGTRGSTSGYFSEASYSHADVCTDAENVREYYCSGTQEQNAVESCGTDFYSSNFCIGNSILRNFTNYYCSSGACGVYSYVQGVQNCTAQQYCSGGQCFSSDSCSDTDGGITASIKGTISGTMNTTPFSLTDYCQSSSNVREYYCIGTSPTSTYQSCGNDYNTSVFCVGDLRYKNVTDYYCALGACNLNKYQVYLGSCTYGCLDGVCKSAPSNSCSDTDGGWVPKVRGTVTGYLGGYPYSNTDYCNGTTIVKEYYCGGTARYSYPLSCAGNGTTMCSNGACI